MFNHMCRYRAIARSAFHVINLVLWAGLSVSPYPCPTNKAAETFDNKDIAQSGSQESALLELGKPIERELSVGQSHIYKVAMTSGQYLHLTVEQRGIDLTVTLFTPGDKKIAEVDGEQVIVGTEVILAIADATGEYRIETRSEKTAKTGRYKIEIKELREATVEDRHRVAADSVFREAKQLQNGTMEERRLSIQKYQESLASYQRVGDRGKEATTLNNMAATYRSLGEAQKALEKYNEALTLSRTTGDRRQEAITLRNMGAAYRSLGETRKALESYNEALPVIQALGDRREEALTLSNMGVAYRVLGEVEKALEAYNKALPLSRAIGDRRQEVIILSNMGAAFRSLGEMKTALEKYNEALQINRAVRDRSSEAVTLNNMGAVYRPLGEIQRALETYYEALRIHREVGDRREEATTLNNIGVVYQMMGETQKALEKYNEALPLRRATGDRSGEAVVLNNIGLVYQMMGEARKALEKYNEALPLRRAVGDRNGEAATLNNIGEVHQSLGEIEMALGKYNEALALTRAVGDRIEEALTLRNMGVIYDKLGETQKALEALREALSLAQAVGDRNAQAITLLGIAQVEQKRGNLSQARQLIEQGVDIIESIRANVVSQELRASYFSYHQKFFEAYLDVLAQLRKQNPATVVDAVALEVCERARARSLLELLNETHADIRQGVDSVLLDRERSLRQRLSAKASAQTRLLARNHTPEQAAAIAKDIAAITSEYADVQTQIRLRSPRYAALTQPQPLTLAEIQQQTLDKDTLLLEYAVGEKRSYLWLVSQRSIESYELPPRAEIEGSARRVYEMLTIRPKRGAAPDEQFIAQAKSLSKMLLGPAAPRLTSKRLVIVAPGALSYVPFAALPAPEDGKRPSADYEPLIARHEIVSVPSASVLATIRREMEGRSPAAKSVAILADPVFDATDSRLKSLKKGNSSTETPPISLADAELLDLTRAIRTMNFPGARSGFARLPFSRQEAEGIAGMTPKGTSLKATDFSASRDLAMSRELSQYRILHFATHGMLNSERPELSGLVFSLVDEEGKPQDGFLRLNEIYNLQLNADLVVLSACETGLGKEIKGEGLIGLTRGFMYAGAPRVVASLWSVDDLATAELMKLFYRHMLNNLSAAAALRAAQLELSRQKRWASPYFWAGFVLHGEWK